MFCKLTVYLRRIHAESDALDDAISLYAGEETDLKD